MNKEPLIFISYSWEDEEHNDWVRKFTDKLLENGIEAKLDQYDVELGDRLPLFMEEGVSKSDYVLIVCTPTYKKKADSRESGVGYEGHIISDELLSKKNERKFIPILRKGNAEDSIPCFLKGKLYIDFSTEEKYTDSFEILVDNIYGVNKKPSIGAKPKRISQEVVSRKNDEKDIKNEDIAIERIVTERVTFPKMDGTSGSALYKIPFKLNKTPSELWKRIFIKTWNSPPNFTLMHRPGIASVVGDNIILNGTTIEEVKKYHRDTLVLCVDRANQLEKETLENEAKKRQIEQQKREEHFKKVFETANEIEF